MNPFNLDLFKGYTDKNPVTVTLDEVVRLITADNALHTTTLSYRHCAYVQQNSSAAQRAKASMPCMAVAVRFSGGKQKTNIMEWTGLSLVDIDHVEEQEVPAVLEKIRTDAHTLLAYVTISGRGVRILYRWQLAGENVMDEKEPTSKANFSCYAQAFRMGNDYYAKLLGKETDRQCKNATRLCGLAHDPEAYYNPEALPFEVEVSLPTDGRGRKSVPLSRALPVVKAELEEVGIAYNPGHRNEYISRLGYLMNLYGVELEKLTEWAVGEFCDYDGDVPAILRSCYTHTDEFHTRRLPRKQQRTGDDGDDRPTYPTVADMEQYLRQQAEFRYNVITGKGEYRVQAHLNPPCEGGIEDTLAYDEQSQQKSGWKAIDNRFIHTLWKGLAARFKIVRVQDIHQLLMSEFLPAFNPFEEYFAGLPRWDGVTD